MCLNFAFLCVGRQGSEPKGNDVDISYRVLSVICSLKGSQRFSEAVEPRSESNESKVISIIMLAIVL